MKGGPRSYRGLVSWSGSDATPWQEADVTNSSDAVRADLPAVDLPAVDAVAVDAVAADDVPADVGALGTVAAELDAIEAALGRIDAGNYGRCRTCGAPIADADLEADPLVLACAAHR